MKLNFIFFVRSGLLVDFGSVSFSSVSVFSINWLSQKLPVDTPELIKFRRN